MELAVNYIAPQDHTGYACAAAGYMRLLQDAGVPVRFQPLQPGTSFGLWYECSPSAAPLAPDAITILHVVPEYYVPLKQWLKQNGIRGPIVGMTVWETSRIPPHWPALLNDLDAVIVPSAWNRAIFAQCGVKTPVYELPHVSEFEGIEADTIALHSVRQRLPSLDGRFLFYSIGAWSFRKGNELLIQAFQKAFGHRSDVGLILKTSPVSYDAPLPRWQRALRKLTGSKDLRQRAVAGEIAGVTLLTENLTGDEIRALHTLGDCYVSCARGEGWGIGLYEAIFFAKPVLAPREGGHREYLRADTYPGLIDGNSVPVHTPGKDLSYQSDQQWFEVKVEDVARKMQWVVENASEANRLAALLSKDIRSHFNREPILDVMLSILKDIRASITP